MTDPLVKWRTAYNALLEEAHSDDRPRWSGYPEVRAACIIAAALIIAEPDRPTSWREASRQMLADGTVSDLDDDRIERLEAAARVVVEAYDNGAFGEWMGPSGSSPMAALRAALETSDD